MGYTLWTSVQMALKARASSYAFGRETFFWATSRREPQEISEIVTFSANLKKRASRNI
jgi:hypothetical protein